MQTGSLRIPMRRRRLRGIVFATLAMCTLILVAAVVSRVGHASNEAAAVPTFPAAVPAPVTASASPVVSAPTTARPATAAPADATTGTLRVERPALPSRVWLDGKKLANPSTSTTCGTHQLKVGWRGHAHAVQIPCGGELVVSH
jgi:hypothetical protein